MKNINAYDWVALVLLVVGGLNWGTIALFNVNLVSLILGDASMLIRIVYGLVGASALYSIYILATKTQ